MADLHLVDAHRNGDVITAHLRSPELGLELVGVQVRRYPDGWRVDASAAIQARIDKPHLWTALGSLVADYVAAEVAESQTPTPIREFAQLEPTNRLPRRLAHRHQRGQ